MVRHRISVSSRSAQEATGSSPKALDLLHQTTFERTIGSKVESDAAALEAHFVWIARTATGPQFYGWQFMSPAL
jgi:hypothetical protein